jgi:ammonia channel protein AmtB
VGFFPTTNVAPEIGHDGILYGGGLLFGYQLASICAASLLAVVVTTVTLFILKLTIGRVDKETAEKGKERTEGWRREFREMEGKVSINLGSCDSFCLGLDHAAHGEDGIQR